MDFSLSELNDVLGDIKNLGEEKINFFKFKNISIDSRTLLKNDLFIAIEGKNFDAHNFLPEVLKKEVKASIPSRLRFLLSPKTSFNSNKERSIKN